MQGHIHLGIPGDLRPYQLANAQQWSRALANQMKVSTAQGEAKYADKDAYDSWVQRTWQRGVGKEADEEGVLYAELDTRIPHQLNLPPLVRLTDSINTTPAASDMRYDFVGREGVLEIGENGRAAIYIDASSQTLDLDYVWLYMRIPPGATATVALYAADNDGKPTGSAIDTAMVNGDSDLHFRWYRAEITATLDNAEYCIVVYPPFAGVTLELVCGPTYTDALTWVSGDSGSTWEANTTLFPYFLTDVGGLNSKGSVVDIVPFNGTAYAAVGDQVYKFSTANRNWTAVGTARSTDITDLEVWGSTLYIGLGDSTNYDTMSTGETYSNGATPGRIFSRGDFGYLWKAIGNSVYYTADGSTWQGPIPCGPTTFKVRGLAMSQGNQYAATDDGLWWIAPGDVARGISPFPGQDEGNGVDMLSFEANLFIPIGGHVYQYSELASLQNIWMTRPEELPSRKLGRVVAAAASTQWLMVGVQPDEASGAPTIWAWNREGWHFMAALPNGLTLTCLRYDRARQRMWCGTDNGLIFHFYVSDYLVNPVRDSQYEFQPYGWLETDWFSSDILEDEKDFDSVFILARQVSSDNPVEAYWQDDQSGVVEELTTEGGDTLVTEGGDTLVFEATAWNYLGLFTEDRQELRWALSSSARGSTEIRLGFLISSNDVLTSPKVEAIRVKYHLQVRDWYRWQVPILVSGKATTRQQLADGTLNPYTVEEQRAHLRELEKRTAPFLYTDISGVTYEVKVEDAQEVILGEIRSNGDYDSVFLFTLGQVHEGEYEE